MFKKLPSREFLKECFDYNEDTGVLTWKTRPISHFDYESGFKSFNTAWSGRIAGFPRKGPSGKTYSHIGINGERYVAHRICAKIAGFDFTEFDEIDHKDGNGLNNAKSNLRVVSNIENGKNRKIYSSNSTGQSGVHVSGGKFVARINYEGRRIHIGTFNNLEDAIKARKEAEKKYGYHKNHGSDRPL